MTDPDVPAAALYLSGWLRGAPLHTETVAEAITAARETHRRRGLGPDAGVLAAFGEESAAGLDADLWAWARHAAEQWREGRLTPDPDHRDAPSGHSYRGFALTNAELDDVFGDDLPDGS